MRPLVWMVAGSVGSWLGVSVVAAVLGVSLHPELLLGMIAPLVSAAATWVAVVRTWTASPARLTGVMIVGFGLKMLGFGAYVAIVLGLLGARPVPFVVSFTSYFIALHLTEALFLRRLFATAAPAGMDGSTGDTGP
jgi:hypothetical protein